MDIPSYTLNSMSVSTPDQMIFIQPFLVTLQVYLLWPNLAKSILYECGELLDLCMHSGFIQLMVFRHCKGWSGLPHVIPPFQIDMQALHICRDTVRFLSHAHSHVFEERRWAKLQKFATVAKFYQDLSALNCSESLGLQLLFWCPVHLFTRGDWLATVQVVHLAGHTLTARIILTCFLPIPIPYNDLIIVTRDRSMANILKTIKSYIKMQRKHMDISKCPTRDTCTICLSTRTLCTEKLKFSMVWSQAAHTDPTQDSALSLTAYACWTCMGIPPLINNSQTGGHAITFNHQPRGLRPPSNTPLIYRDPYFYHLSLTPRLNCCIQLGDSIITFWLCARSIRTPLTDDPIRSLFQSMT